MAQPTGRLIIVLRKGDDLALHYRSYDDAVIAAEGLNTMLNGGTPDALTDAILRRFYIRQSEIAAFYTEPLHQGLPCTGVVTEEEQANWEAAVRSVREIKDVPTKSQP